MKIKFKILILTLAIFFAFGTALPAKAFYIEIPQILKDAISALKTSNTLAQEGSNLLPPPAGTIFCNALNRQTTMEECGVASGQQPGNTSIFCDALGKQTTKDECDASNSQQQPQQNQPQQNDNQQMMNQQPQNQNQPQQNNDQQKMNQNEQGNRENGNNKNFLQDVQRGAKQMERSLTQFDTLIKTTEKAGGTVKAEMKESADKLRGMMAQAKSAKTSEDLQDFDMGEANQLAQELEQYRRDVQNQTQQLKQVKQQIRNAETAVKSFEKQIAKGKNCVTEEVKTQLATLKTTIATIKNAKTWEEVEAAGIDNMGDLFNDLNDSREQLDTCSRWPQILKQVDQQLKTLNTQVKKSKTLVTKLATKGVDLSVPFAAFEDGVTKMKAIREDAVAKMKSNDFQSAFDLLQDDFFGQMDDIMENQQTIQTMSNLGTFNSQFKKDTANAQKQINSLKKQKIDTAELVSILADAKTTGAEILVLIKQKTVDLDAIMSSMGDLQDLNNEFSDKVAELTGDEGNDMQNIIGPAQIKTLQMPTGMNQFISQPQQMQPQQQIINTNGGPNF
ncbi:MAG: hypothetical protein WCV83_03675 [Candidatus Magasanikbacteria bacterium]